MGIHVLTYIIYCMLWVAIGYEIHSIPFSEARRIPTTPISRKSTASVACSDPLVYTACSLLCGPSDENVSMRCGCSGDRATRRITVGLLLIFSVNITGK